MPAHWLAILLLAVFTSGCVSLPVVGPTLLLVRADRQAGEGDWEAALASYDELLARFPNDPAAPRALRSRDTLVASLEAQQELARRREEVERLRSELVRLQQEEARLREEEARLQQEKASLRQEEAQLREDRRRLRVETTEMRDEMMRLRFEGTELREELTRRRRDLARTRQELGARQAEADRLRSDLERLKEIDLQPERKR